MSDTLIRHLIALIGTIVSGLIFWAAYYSGVNGWWFTVFGLFIVYFIVYALVEV